MEHEEFNFTRPVMEDVDPMQADWEAAEDRASAIWSVPLRKRVRFRLEGMRDDVEGVIRLARRPKVWECHEPLELCMKQMAFTNIAVESCTVIE